jgi:hypothetical protein
MSDTYADDAIHQLPEHVTYDQVVQALAAIAPDLEPRHVQHIVIAATSVDIATWHAESPHERVHTYRIEHEQGAATEGSNR